MVVDWYKYDEKGRGNLIIGFYPNYRISDKFKLNYRADIILSDKEQGFVDMLEEAIIFGQRNRNTIINSIGGNFIFNNKMALNLAFRHYYSEVFIPNFILLKKTGNSLPIVPTATLTIPRIIAGILILDSHGGLHLVVR